MALIRNHRWIMPAFGIFAAIATNTAMSVSSLAGNGALALFPLMVIFWYFERFSRAEMGFVLGQLRHYVLALLHPILVLGLAALVAWTTGAANFENTNWSKAALDFGLVALMTIPATLVTEDGFFRGWLFASLKRSGWNKYYAVLWSGIAFGVWHFPYALLVTGFDPSSADIPLLIINASIVGVIWGMMRLISGSVVVPSVIHGLWNGAVYVFFNSGAEIGALGIQQTAIYGPETGVLGLVLNLAFAVGLVLWYRRSISMAGAQLDLGPKLGSQKQDAA